MKVVQKPRVGDSKPGAPNIKPISTQRVDGWAWLAALRKELDKEVKKV